MKSTLHGRVALAVAAACVLGGVSSSHAATVALNAGDTAGTSSYNAGTNWVGGQAPSAANDYVVDPTLAANAPATVILRTPQATGSFAFAGNSLTLKAGGLLYLKSNEATNPANFGTKGTVTYTINNLSLSGGLIYGSPNTAPGPTAASQTKTLVHVFTGTNMTVTGTNAVTLQGIGNQGGFTTVGNVIDFDAPISGTGGFLVGGGDANLAATRWVQFTKVNSFTGGVTVGSGSAAGFLAGQGQGIGVQALPGGFGTGNVTVNASSNGTTNTLNLGNITAGTSWSADLGTDFINDNATLSFNTANSNGLILSFTGNDNIAGLIVNGVPLPAGTYGSAGNTSVDPANRLSWISGNNGTLTVIPEPASMMALSLVAALGMRRRR